MRDRDVSLSVLMPVYNARRYVAKAVESILDQDFVDFEFLIIDDGSTDGSAEILDDYARRDPRIRLVRRENRGLVASLNEGIALARAPFIARMDADDIALPHRLRVQADFLAAHPEVVCAGGGIDVIDEKGRRITRIPVAQGNARIQELALQGKTPICHPTAVMRKEAVLAAGAYDPDMMLAEDLDLWLRLGEQGELANVPETVLQYRLHPASVSEAAGSRQIDRMRLACARACERRGVASSFEADAPWRPGEDRLSKHRFALKYGWWAFNSGERHTARAYGGKAIAARPFSMEGWRLLVCALVKPTRRAG